MRACVRARVRETNRNVRESDLVQSYVSLSIIIAFNYTVIRFSSALVYHFFFLFIHINMMYCRRNVL